MKNKFFTRQICACAQIRGHWQEFYETGQCIGCGKCSMACPLNTIDIANYKPQWGIACTHCMACVHQCPERAVEFRKISAGKNR